jgi:hypothetical protein
LVIFGEFGDGDWLFLVWPVFFVSFYSRGFEGVGWEGVLWGWEC